MSEQSCSLHPSSKPGNGRKRLSDIAEVDVVDGFGGFYVNVNNADAFLISMAYSKASIAFICLIGALTAFNTLTFTGQISNTNLLCSLNNYLPLGKDLRKITMPIVYYCRFLELSVSTNILQLLFCLAALVCALNRRSNLFLLCYSFLCVTLLFGGCFLLTLIILNYEHFIVQAVDEMLEWVLNYDNSFCQMLEPILECLISRLAPSKALRISTLANSSLATVPLSNYDDAIEMACGNTPRRHAFNSTMTTKLPECTDFLTSFLLHPGCYVTAHAIFKRRQRLEKMRRGSSSCCADVITKDSLIAPSIMPTAKKMSDELTRKNIGPPIIVVDDMPLTSSSSNNNYYQSI
uniref:Uncharacterized protein n=1 Tax=Ditylenchus dipsaci TaxID=166011 RepID=A0A915EJ67_9BILA